MRSSQDDRYATGRYLLRVYQPGYQAPEAVELELAWLASMCHDADLPVPEPVPALDGRLITRAGARGVPGERTCSLLRWIKGREPKREEIQPCHYVALGQLMARMHRHAAQWKPPAGLSKRHYDWEGLFTLEGEDGQPSMQAWQLLPPEYVKPFETVAELVKRVMELWRKGTEVYGLIHGDLGMGANVLFWKGDARIIDFDDSGYGYYLFDLAIVLEDSQDHQIQRTFRDALLEGYTRLRALPEEQLQSLDLFLAAYAVFWSLYAVDAVQYHPEDRAEIYERMARYFRLVNHFLDKLI